MMTLTKFGIREWGSALIVAVILLAGCAAMIKYQWHACAGVISAAVILLVLFCICAFFRNPVRNIPAGNELIISPADGTVKDITELESFEFFPENTKVVRIGIFLSVFNVHVNRAPADMTVTKVFYREGEFLDARHPECGKRNEAMTVAGTASAGGKQFPVAVRQISGAIARRIVCPVQEGASMSKGFIYGMIKFGSRTELYLPADLVKVNVAIGDKVRGGETIMAIVNGAEK